jgi:3-keto-disaccharide hydrolase
MMSNRFCRLVLTFLIFVLPAFGADKSGFTSLFDGKTLNGWVLVHGHGPGYVVEDGKIVCPADGGGNLFTEKEYANFVFRFEFLLTPGGNNGIGIRAPLEGRTSSVGMEIQILDDSNAKYRGRIHPEQYHGSIYGVIPARTGFLKPVGQWNKEEIVANGRRITVTLNGVIVLDDNLDIVREPEVLRHHPGLSRTSGHIGFLGHNSHVEFRNIRVKELP